MSMINTEEQLPALSAEARHRGCAKSVGKKPRELHREG